MKYDVDYFIDKFEKIPDEKWCVLEYQSGTRHCALGWCGASPGQMTEESVALANLWRNSQCKVSNINDGLELGYNQKTPKQRILAALRDLR